MGVERREERGTAGGTVCIYRSEVGIEDLDGKRNSRFPFPVQSSMQHGARQLFLPAIRCEPETNRK